MNELAFVLELNVRNKQFQCVTLWLKICFCLFFISACSTAPQIIEIDIVRFKGDIQPFVTSKNVLAGDLSNLSEGETLVSAIAPDGSGTLAQPSAVDIQIVESIIKNTSVDLDLLLSRCDLDGDGILDIYCPELIKYLEDGALGNNRGERMIGNEKFVTFQSWYLLALDKDTDEDIWQRKLVIDRAKVKHKDTPVYLKLLNVNRGNRTFEGELTIFAQIPPQMKVGKVSEVSKIVDRISTKSNLEYIPFGSYLITSFMDDYAVMKTIKDYDINITAEGNIKLTIKNIKLAPGEGINLEYSTSYTVEDK